MATTREILDWLLRKGFLSDSTAKELEDTPDPYALGVELAQRGYLTQYQVKKVFKGKGDSLVLGPYRILDRIGAGGMGRIYRAWHTRLKLPVAVKMIHREHLDSTRAMERFAREIETAAHLEHPNIVLIRDAGEEGGRPYLIMDFVDGRDLHDVVHEGGPLPIAQACEFARQAALGLQHAFERGVVHRDIKPGNLLVTNDTPPVVKVLDFGLARFKDEQRPEGPITQFGAVLGTVEYMAPEQALSASSADARSDVYSLGCTLYYLLAGQSPFSGGTMVEKLAVRLAGGPPSIRSLRADVPESLDKVLAKVMAREPSARYQTPLEFAQALEPFTTAQTEHNVNQPTLNQSAPLDAMPLRARMNPAAAELQQLSPPRKGLAGESQPVAAHNLESDFDLASGSGDTLTDNPFAFDVATKRGPSSSEDSIRAPVRPRQKSATTSKNAQVWRLLALLRPWRWQITGGIVTVAVGVALLRTFGGGESAEIPLPAASLRAWANQAELRFDLKTSTKKALVVHVERTAFDGPVNVSIVGLPDGIRAEPKTIAKNREMVEVPITVSYGTPNQTLVAEIIAVADSLNARTTVSVVVEGTEKAPGKKKGSK